MIMAPAGHGTDSPSGLAFGSGCHGPYMPDGEGRAAPRSSTASGRPWRGNIILACILRSWVQAAIPKLC